MFFKLLLISIVIFVIWKMKKKRAVEEQRLRAREKQIRREVEREMEKKYGKK